MILTSTIIREIIQDIIPEEEEEEITLEEEQETISTRKVLQYKREDIQEDSQEAIQGIILEGVLETQCTTGTIHLIKLEHCTSNLPCQYQLNGHLKQILKVF